MKNILCIYRHERFSPNAVERDRAIIEAVGRRLRHAGHAVTLVREEDLSGEALAGLLRQTDFCFSMARSPQVVGALRRSGVSTVNTPDSVALCCHRASLDRLMRGNGIPVPPADGADGYWMKRGEGPVQTPDDVVFCRDAAALREARGAFARRGIEEVVVSAHVVGDVLKFYGVSGSPFFRFCYPAETGATKFGGDTHNAPPQHYAFSARALRDAVERLARMAGVAVYGGDCVVRADGSFAIIDFNDWPSFDCCRDEAADTIANLLPAERT